MIVSKLFYPDFIEHDGMVCFVEQFRQESAASWMEHLGGDRRAVERMMNHVHACDRFHNSRVFREQDAIYAYLLNVLSRTWTVALRDCFPDTSFDATVDIDDADGDATLTFRTTPGAMIERRYRGMTTEPAFDVAQIPELRSLAEEVERTGRPRTLRRHDRLVAVLVPIASTLVATEAPAARPRRFPKGGVVAATAGIVRDDGPVLSREQERAAFEQMIADQDAASEST